MRGVQLFIVELFVDKFPFFTNILKSSLKFPASVSLEMLPKKMPHHSINHKSLHNTIRTPLIT